MCFAGLAWLCGIVAVAGPARAHDGHIAWRTQRVPGMVLHHPARLDALADHVLAAAVDARRHLTSLFDARDGGTLQITLDDYDDDANGFATLVPYDRIHVRAYPPSPESDLGDHGDWVRTLVFHELTHVLHIGQVSGVPELVNTVLGRTWLPNGDLPRLLVEGIATHVETRHTGGERGAGQGGVGARGGRVDSPQFMARMRATWREQRWPELTALTGRPLTWPRGTGWYQYGSWLVDRLVAHHGHGALRRFIRRYGERIVPYGQHALAREVFGRSFAAIWKRAGLDLQQRVETEDAWRACALVPQASPWPAVALPGPPTACVDRELPASPARRLSDEGEFKGRIRAHPSLPLAYLAVAPADGLRRIEAFASDGRRWTVHRCELDCEDVVVSPDGRWLYFTETRPWQRLYGFQDAFALPLAPDGRAAGGGPRRLTEAWRARELSVSPDGHWLLATVVEDGATAIEALDLRRARSSAEPAHALGAGLARAAGLDTQRAVVRLVAPAPVGTVLSSPVLDDAGVLWWTRNAGLQRRAWRCPVTVSRPPAGVQAAPLGGQPTIRCTERPALAPLAPIDGVALAADASATGLSAARADWLDELQRRPGGGLFGLVQLGAFRDAAARAPGAPWQLATWTRTGVASASPASGGVFSVEHVANGLDVFWVPTATGGPPPPMSATPRLERGDATPARYTPPGVRAPTDGYSPWPTVWPTAWAPEIALVRGAGGIDLDATRASLHLFGRDAVQWLAWQLDGSSALSGRYPVVTGELSVERWEPRWSLAASWLEVDGFARRGFTWTRVPLHVGVGRVAVDWRYPLARAGIDVSASWRVAHQRVPWRDDVYDAFVGPQDPMGLPPRDPAEGWDGVWTAGVRYQRAERYPNSIVIERLDEIGLYGEIGDRWLGEPASRRALDVVVRKHWRLGGHRVLQVFARGSKAWATRGRGPAYALQGLTAFPLDALLYGGAGAPVGTIRGLPNPTGVGATAAGNLFGVGTLALHWPLLDVGHGADLLPVFLRRIWLTPFVDAGAVLDDDAERQRAGLTRSGWAASTGAALAIRYEAGYLFSTVLQLGYAEAFGSVRARQWYATIGL